MENRLKALVVDDSDLGRCMTGTIIDKVFSYDEAENGLLSVSMYKNAVASGAPYDIIFMDIVMPEMDGKTAVRKIREYEAAEGLAKKPIIMISASEMIDANFGIGRNGPGAKYQPSSPSAQDLSVFAQRH